MPIPANGAGRGPVDAGPLPEDEAAVQGLGRLSRSNRTQKGLYHTVMGPRSHPRRDHPRTSVPGLADALFAKVQQRVRAVLFGTPQRSFYTNEVIALARSGTGAVQRELRRLDVLRDKA